MTAPRINTAISPALDPGTYLAVEGVNDSTRAYIDDVVSLMVDIYGTLDKLANARKLADSNPSWNDEQKILIVGAEATKQKDRLARRLDRTVRDLDGRIQHVQQELVRPVQQAAAGPLAAEVRSHFKMLDRSERTKLLNEAFAAEDEATLQAVLGSQPFLSGLTREDQVHYLHRYHSKRQPQLVERLELMVRVRDLMNTSGANGSAFHRSFERVVRAKPGVVNAIAQADAKARAALNIEPTT